VKRQLLCAAQHRPTGTNGRFEQTFLFFFNGIAEFCCYAVIVFTGRQHYQFASVVIVILTMQQSTLSFV